MRTRQMREKCQALLARLDELEALLSHVPEDDRAFVFQSTTAVHELQQIAQRETTGNATRQQVQHILRISAKAQQLLRRVPKEALRSLRQGD